MFLKLAFLPIPHTHQGSVEALIDDKKGRLINYKRFHTTEDKGNVTYIDVYLIYS